MRLRMRMPVINGVLSGVCVRSSVIFNRALCLTAAAGGSMDYLTRVAVIVCPETRFMQQPWNL